MDYLQKNVVESETMEMNTQTNETNKNGASSHETIENGTIHKDDDEKMCSICWDEIPEDAAGYPNNCQHVFHHECILKWAEVTNLCPMCKERFSSVRQEGKRAKKVRNKDQKVRLYDSDDNAAANAIATQEEESHRDDRFNVECYECGGANDEEFLLLCDSSGCHGAAHSYCLGFGRSVPEGDWYCKPCSQRRELLQQRYPTCAPTSSNYSNTHSNSQSHSNILARNISFPSSNISQDNDNYNNSSGTMALASSSSAAASNTALERIANRVNMQLRHSRQSNTNIHARNRSHNIDTNFNNSRRNELPPSLQSEAPWGQVVAAAIRAQNSLIGRGVAITSLQATTSTLPNDLKSQSSHNETSPFDIQSTLPTRHQSATTSPITAAGVSPSSILPQSSQSPETSRTLSHKIKIEPSGNKSVSQSPSKTREDMSLINRQKSRLRVESKPEQNSSERSTREPRNGFVIRSEEKSQSHSGINPRQQPITSASKKPASLQDLRRRILGRPNTTDKEARETKIEDISPIVAKITHKKVVRNPSSGSKLQKVVFSDDSDHDECRKNKSSNPFQRIDHIGKPRANAVTSSLHNKSSASAKVDDSISYNKLQLGRGDSGSSSGAINRRDIENTFLDLEKKIQKEDSGENTINQNKSKTSFRRPSVMSLMQTITNPVTSHATYRDTKVNIEEACKFIDNMETAIIRDREACNKGGPIYHCANMLQDLQLLQHRARQSDIDIYLEYGLLKVINKWLMPLPNGDRLETSVTRQILRFLSIFRLQNSHIKNSGSTGMRIPSTLFRLANRESEPEDVKHMARNLIESWQQYVMKNSSIPHATKIEVNTKVDMYKRKTFHASSSTSMPVSSSYKPFLVTNSRSSTTPGSHRNDTIISASQGGDTQSQKQYRNPPYTSSLSFPGTDDKNSSDVEKNLRKRARNLK